MTAVRPLRRRLFAGEAIKASELIVFGWFDDVRFVFGDAVELQKIIVVRGVLYAPGIPSVQKAFGKPAQQVQPPVRFPAAADLRRRRSSCCRQTGQSPGVKNGLGMRSRFGYTLS